MLKGRFKDKVLIFVLLPLIFFLAGAKVYPSNQVLRKIKNSIPQKEADWKIIKADQHYNESDGSIQLDLLWAKGGEEVSATAILHKSLKAAKKQFQNPPEGEAVMKGFFIKGIGDEAYLFPPVIRNQKGPFNLRFKKARYEIMLSANNKDTVKRCAGYIVDAISQPDK